MTQGEGALLNIAGGISFGVILDYFGLSQETLIILTVMLILDWIFGVVNAYLKGTLQSKIMVNGLIKKLTRWCLPFIVIAVIRGAGFENIEIISTTILSILIVAEGYSVLGNIYSINYKETLPEIDALKLLFEWIAKLLKGKVEDTLNDKDSKDEGKDTGSKD